MVPASPWLRDVARPEFEGPTQQRRPGGELHCQLAVVGGGITGLHAALRGASLGLDVVLLEAHYCGYGASGRNAGHLTPTIGKDLPSLGLLYGDEKGSRLVSIAEAAVDFTEQSLCAQKIDADYEPVGNVLTAVHERQNAALERVELWARRLGARIEQLDDDACRRLGLPACVHRAVRESVGGILHPGKYVDGLRRACLAAGVRIFEQLPAQEFDRPKIGTVEVRHPEGSLRCEHLVIANNAFAPAMGVMNTRLVPLYVQLFRTAPLSPAQRDSLAWESRSGMYTAHELLESYRLSADDRIIGGAKMVDYAFGGRVRTEAKPRWSERLSQIFRQRFPELGTLAIEEHWGGPIAMTLDFLPALGKLKGDPRIGYALAFAGHGLAMAGYAGHSIVDELLGRHSGNRTLFEHRNWWIPPEPLRWLTAKALLGLFGCMDARLDRAIERSRG